MYNKLNNYKRFEWQMISRFEKYRNDLILSKNSTFIRALDKNLFRDYSNNHILFIKNTNGNCNNGNKYTTVLIFWI